MLNFGKFLFNEAVTMNGKKIGDDNDTSTTNTGSTNTNNTTNTGSTTTPSMGVDDDSDYTKMPRDDDTGTTNNTSTTGSNDDVDDYTQMSRDDDTTSTNSAGGTGNSSLGGATSTDTSTTGGGTDSITGGTPGITPAGGTDTGADTGGAEDEVDDYTKMDRDDTPSGTTPTGATGTETGMGTGTDTAAGGATDPGTDDVDDYTQMPRDDASAGGDTGATDTPNTNPIGADTGTPGTDGGQPAGGDAGGGDQPQGGGGAAEDDNVEDYTQTPRDGEDPSGDGGDTAGGDPSASGDTSTDAGTGTDPQQELKDLEAKLFSELSPEQLQIKDNELKIQYINLYEDIGKTEQRVNRIVKTENNEDVVAFISKKLDDLKTLVHRILTETYQTQTWLQNMLTYQHCLSIFAGIGELLRNLSRKDDINKNINKDDKIEDLTNDVITSTNSEG